LLTFTAAVSQENWLKNASFKNLGLVQYLRFMKKGQEGFPINLLIIKKLFSIQKLSTNLSTNLFNLIGNQHE